jgi:hypothetical protein
MSNVTLTARSLEIFLAYARDAGNWSGNPWLDGNVTLTKEDRGNLTQLKRASLLTTESDAGDEYIVFTAAAVTLAAEHGVTLDI